MKKEITNNINTKKTALDTLLTNAKEGRHIDRNYVANVLKNITFSPFLALYLTEFRRDCCLGLLHALKTDEPDGGEVYQEFMRNANYKTCVADYLKAYNKVARDRGQSSEAIINLGMLGFFYEGAIRRYVSNIPGELQSKKDTAKAYVRTNNKAEVKFLELTVMENMQLDTLHQKVVIPFLRLSVVELFGYLESIQFVKDANFYQRYLVRDVEAWRALNGNDPTVADVLIHAAERFAVVADIQDRFYHGIYTPLAEADRDGEKIEQPFNRKNIQGTYWPPEEDEGMLAGTWIWLLAVMGPLNVALFLPFMKK